MRLALALGIAAAGIAFAAYAETSETHRTVIHGGPGMMRLDMGDIDANHDGWISRAEASAQIDRMFEHMDANHDGKLDESDHAAMRTNFELHREGGEHGDHDVRTESDGHGGTVVHLPDGREIHIDRDGNGEGDVHVETSGDGRNRTVIITRGGDGDHDGDEHHGGHGDHSDTTTIERNVTIVRSGDGRHGDHDGPPMPHAMHMGPPMAMMMFASSEEADVNGDGALSQEEFRNLHLRFFDAGDVNGDGKVRMHMPPVPPEPPTPPTPPAPPRRH